MISMAAEKYLIVADMGREEGSSPKPQLPYFTSTDCASESAVE
jgi:hypothetical protein